MSNEPDLIPVDQTRIDDLSNAIGDCILRWQRQHHHQKVDEETAACEVLTAVTTALGYTIACIDGCDLRERFGQNTAHFALSVLRKAVSHPVPRAVLQ